MKHTLLLRRMTGVPIESHPVYLYEIVGLPEGEHAWISDAEKNGNWQISHSKNSGLGEWTGNYKSPEEALAVLRLT
jgi:hypothetical protein